MDTSQAKQLLKRVVFRIDIPKSLLERNNPLEALRDKVIDTDKVVEQLRANSVQQAAEVEMFNVKLAAAVEGVEDSGAKKVEVTGNGNWYSSELLVIGYYEPTEKELRRMNGTAKSLLTRRVTSLPKERVRDWGSIIINHINTAFKEADLELAGMKKQEEFNRLCDLLLENVKKHIEKLKADVKF
jgi:hypothetical protein